MSTSNYLYGVKAIIEYIGGVSDSTVKRWRKRQSLKILKTSSSKLSRVITKPEWVDEWLAKLGGKDE